MTRGARVLGSALLFLVVQVVGLIIVLGVVSALGSVFVPRG